MRAAAVGAVVVELILVLFQESDCFEDNSPDVKLPFKGGEANKRDKA